MSTSLIFLQQPKQHFLISFASLPCKKLRNFQPRRLQIPMFRSISGRFCRRPTNPLLIRSSAASSSPSLSGSPDPYLDSKTHKKQKMIAGKEQEDLLDPTSLADPDSCFCEFQGVNIHHKVYDPQTQADDDTPIADDSQLSQNTQTIGFPMILLHGFGASVFSWNRVMKPLARLIGSKVLAFDRPAFGLTSRILNSLRANDSKPLNPYSMAFSVLTTLYFIGFLAADKAILVGHSAGSIVAIDTYFEAPDHVAALILIAPAIFAPRDPKSTGEGNEEGKEDIAESPFAKFLRILTRFGRIIINAFSGIIKGMTSMLGSLYKNALAAFLRSTVGRMLVRMAIDKFGVAGVRNAWYDPKQVTDQVIEGYTKPLRAKGWDRALVEFTVAMITDNASDKKLPLSKRLKEIKCPVLIVTGDTDRIVPAWNAERLARAIPGSVLEVIKKCGHLPQEERPDEFISVIAKFLRTAFGGSPQPLDLKLQASVS